MQLGIVASMIAIGYAGYQVGRHLTNNKWEKRQDQSNKEWEKKLEQERQQREPTEDIAITVMRDRIRWTRQIQASYTARLRQNLSEADRVAFHHLIDQLETSIRTMEESMEDINDKQRLNR